MLIMKPPHDNLGIVFLNTYSSSEFVAKIHITKSLINHQSFPGIPTPFSTATRALVRARLPSDIQVRASVLERGRTGNRERRCAALGPEQGGQTEVVGRDRERTWIEVKRG